jgi:hypothetical protein
VTVTPEEASVELSEAASISSLCATFNNLQANLPQLPLGYLSFSGTTTSNQRFLVQITASGQERAPRKTISVEEFIRTSLGSGQFGTRDKLEFALALASSLLWLYSTPWLKALWTSRDILLLQNRGAIDRYSLREPYVQYAFAGNPVVYAEPDPSLLDDSIFALGVIFLQAVEEAPLEVLYQTYVSETDARLSKEEMVRKIEPIVYKRIMSPTWRGVIRRCIYGIIDERNPTEDLDNDQFLRLFYDKIILPLSEALDVATGRQNV